MKCPYRKAVSLFKVTTLLSVLLLVSCGKEEHCSYLIGITDFRIDPNSAYYSGLSMVGGYMYLNGGSRGVFVYRDSYNHFLAYERACPHDDGQVKSADGWSDSILECPECHTFFIVTNDGIPLEDGATTCPLYQYSTTYSDGYLYVY